MRKPSNQIVSIAETGLYLLALFSSGFIPSLSHAQADITCTGQESAFLLCLPLRETATDYVTAIRTSKLSLIHPARRPRTGGDC